MCAERSMPTPSDDAAADIALCRATLYGALALGFRPPTAETIERLVSAAGAAALADAARLLDAHAGVPGLAACAAALHCPEPALELLAHEYRRLFGHTARGAVPAYETEYGCEALFQQPQELGDLAGFLRAFGLTLLPAARERVDHVSCECEFLSFLAWKEAYALHAGDGPMREATEHAARLFLRDHLGRFVPAFCVRLVREQPHRFYGALGELLRVLTQRDCERLGVPSGLESLGLRPDPATVSVPRGCGAEADCGACPGGVDSP